VVFFILTIIVVIMTVEQHTMEPFDVRILQKCRVVARGAISNGIVAKEIGSTKALSLTLTILFLCTEKQTTCRILIH
jgi:hypothetical protein